MALRASIVVVSFNEEHLVADCLTSVLDQDVPQNEYEVIVVDNGSQDRTPLIVREQFPSVTLVDSGGNLGYPAGMNLGLKYAHASRLIMLSCDTVVPRGWLSALLRPMEEDPDVKVTHAAMLIPGDPGYDQGFATRALPKSAAYHDMSRLSLIEPHWVSTSDPPIPTLHVAGASAALDLSILEELGGYMMDGDFFLDCDEIDLGFRVNSLGYRVLAVPAAAYYHRHPFNTKMRFSRKLMARLLRLQRNKALTFYKNLHTLEWLAWLPFFMIGGAMKPLVYADRFSPLSLIFSVLALELFVWLGFLTALIGHFPKYAAKRRISLRNRRRPGFWFLKQLLARPSPERSRA